jgi:hypothetical protein
MYLQMEKMTLDLAEARSELRKEKQKAHDEERRASELQKQVDYYTKLNIQTAEEINKLDRDI